MEGSTQFAPTQEGQFAPFETIIWHDEILSTNYIGFAMTRKRLTGVPYDITVD